MNTKYNLSTVVNPTQFSDYSELMGHFQAQGKVNEDASAAYNEAYRELQRASEYRDIVMDYTSLTKNYIKGLVDCKTPAHVEKLRKSYDDKFKSVIKAMADFEKKNSNLPTVGLVESRGMFENQFAQVTKMMAQLTAMKGAPAPVAVDHGTHGFIGAPPTVGVAGSNMSPKEALMKHLRKEVTFKEAGVLSFFENTKAAYNWTLDQGAVIFKDIHEHAILWNPSTIEQVKSQWTIWCKFVGVDTPAVN